MIYSNPFDLLRSEQVDLHGMFHDFFGPEILSLLDQGGTVLWDRLQVIRAAPGGGKTTLLRLFSNSSLQKIYDKRKLPLYRSLEEQLRKIGAWDEYGPQICGIYIPCSANYSSIEDIRLDQNSRDKLFWTLLNVRVFMELVRSIVAERNLTDYQDIEFYPNELEGALLSNLLGTGNIKDKYRAAENLEQKICIAIDSVEKPQLDSITTTNGPLIWKMLTRDSIKVKGELYNRKILIMLDDAQYLSLHQRELIIGKLQNSLPVARWIAERYQGLSHDDVIPHGALQGRDYNTIRIEDWCTNSKNSYNRLLGYIADQRIQHSRIKEVNSFDSLTSEMLPRDDTLSSGIEKIRKRVQLTVDADQRFRSWLSEEDLSTADPVELMTRIRSLEIRIVRKQSRENTLFNDFEFPVDSNMKRDSSLSSAARLFISREFQLPYYYGGDNLKALSSGNTEQYLRICKEIYSLANANATLKRKRDAFVTAKQQHNVIIKLAKQKYDQIGINIPYGRYIQSLVSCIGEMAQEKTYAPTAPYAPGITGISLSKQDARYLSDSDYLKRNEKYRVLAAVITNAIANNIFETRDGTKCKGNEWLVLYLNRLLCAYFGLPLGYGGFKEQKLETLSTWIQIPSKIIQEGLF